MAFLQIKSDNPDISFVLEKNPNGSPLIKEIRRGSAFGYYSKNSQTEYNIWFKDGPNELSFPEYYEQEYEYLSVSKYNSPICYNTLLKDYFHSAIRSKNEKDIKANNTIIFNIMKINRPDYIQLFGRYFPLIKIEGKELGEKTKNFHLTFSNQGSLYELMNFIQLFTLFVSILNKEPFYGDYDILAKYANIINNIDSPYFIKYLFKSRMIKSQNDFIGLKSILDKSETYKYDFSFGNTHEQRINSILDKFSYQYPILDIGCGEGQYVTRFARKTLNNIYGVDISEEQLEITQNKIEKYQLNNVKLFNSFETFICSEFSKEKVDILLTEVIEHMSLEQAKDFIISILDIVDFNRFIITTPNVEFNAYYKFENDEKRHEEHQFELNSNEFLNLLNDCILSSKKDIKIQSFACGDIVNGIQPTNAAILTKN